MRIIYNTLVKISEVLSYMYSFELFQYLRKYLLKNPNE